MRPALKTRMLWTGARGLEGVRAFRRLIRPGTSPDLLIVGAQKAGTTSLFNYLEELPGFEGAQRKEVRFFNQDARYRRGSRWYEGFFDGRQLGVHFEATPEYLYHPLAPVRIREHYPGVRIVIMLREPVSRAYSAWNMYRHWAENRFMPLPMWQTRRKNPLFQLFFSGSVPTFEESVEYEMGLMDEPAAALEPGIIRRGIYADQVGRYFEHFDVNQILVVGFRELVNEPNEVVNRVAAFSRTGIVQPAVPFGRDGGGAATHNAGYYPANCPAETAARLQAFYAPHNRRLWDLLGHEVAW